MQCSTFHPRGAALAHMAVHAVPDVGAGSAGCDLAADGRRGEEHHPGHRVDECHRRGRVHAGGPEAHHHVLFGAQQLPDVRTAQLMYCRMHL